MNPIIQSHIKEHQDVLDTIKTFNDTIEKVSSVLINSLKNDGTIYWCGNGGSASDSQHLAGELVGRFMGDRKPLRSIALNADSAVMTCIVNDYGMNIFFQDRSKDWVERAMS